jgi:hypothetical protein
LLILDEPTEGIQPSVIKEIGAVIKKLAARGDMAILLVEQFYDFAAELADQYLVMSRGEIVQQGRGENMEAEGVRGLVPSNCVLICSFLTIITHHEPTRLALFTPSWHAELELAYARFGDCTRRCSAGTWARCGCRSTCTPKARGLPAHHRPPAGRDRRR